MHVWIFELVAASTALGAFTPIGAWVIVKCIRECREIDTHNAMINLRSQCKLLKW